MKELMQIGGFAAKAGVTIRALRHYDRIGLLKPGLHKESGYRMYSYADFIKLEQILCLKFLGFGLGDIKRLLNGKAELAESILMQKQMLQSKILQLNKILGAIRDYETGFKSIDTDWELIINIIRRINMEESKDWAMQFYSGEQLERIGTPNYSPEQAERDSQRWGSLFAKIRSVIDKPKDSAEVREVMQEYYSLINEFTKGHKDIENSLGNLWSNIGLAPDEMRRYYEMNADVFEFIERNK